ncbi:aminotransferase class I/II-fold pyridoxal phosphate-dependent enzyme [Trueperella pyogenes]|uniref:MalY/PatB family protein n=1 Tax=Trueperella pyogenes TaxID=1661 RepID=UPI00345DCEDA
MNFDSITIDQLRAAGSLKWTTFPDQIGMFVAEMDLGLAPAVRDVLTGAANLPGIGYRSTADAQALAAATAAWLGAVSDFSPTSESIFAVPDVVSSARLAIDSLTTPASPVIVPTPAYMGFTQLIPAMGRDMIEVPSVRRHGRLELDLTGIRAGFEAGAEALILVNPANPTGRVFTRPELLALADVVADYPSAFVFADDIHAPFILDGEYVPYASVSSIAGSHTVMALAASKGWNIPGLKCAQLVVTNPDLVKRLQPALGWAASMTSTIGSAAAVAAYTDGRKWQAAVVDYIRDNRDLMMSAVERWPGVTMEYMEGTYIAWLDFSQAIDSGLVSQPVAKWLGKHAGVAMTPGALCGRGYENFVRAILATPRPILRQAIAQIEQALGG